MSDSKHYTFGDNDVAAERLQRLAEAYAPSTKAFLAHLAREPARRVVDLGCGPGHTTALLGSIFPDAAIVGLDSSPRFVDLAQRRYGDPAGERPGGLAFALHDVTKVPFPTAPADLVFGRFVLTHLEAPRAVVRAWAEIAARGARLALVETMELASEDALFRGYYAIVAAMQRSLGQSLTIGAEMTDYLEGTPWTVESSVAERVELPAPVMAHLHALNIQTWRSQPFVQENCSSSEIDALARGLRDVAEGRRDAPPVVSRLRHLVARRL